MANPAGPGADGAYDRAIAAYQQGSYDVARQWTLEALAQDAEHPRARALLARLDAVRRPPAPPAGAARPASPYAPQGQGGGPEVVSTDPTVLITRASRSSNPEPIEPTVLIRREDRPRRRVDTEPLPPPPIPARAPAPAPFSEPTVIAQRPSRSTQAPPPPPPPAGGGRSAPRTPAARGGTSGTRGVIIAVAAVAAAALLVVAGIAAVRWLWPAGQTLTLTKPTGGTIVGPGLECGTRGTNCATTRPTGDPVELVAQPDDHFVFSGFTGDCAPMGRVAMSQARKCGATFDPITAAPTAVTFPLTITKPSGGTIVGAGGILCGTLGSNCSADVPNGAPVALHFEADSGYTFLAFTGECSASGEMTMTSAKTCSATFAPTSTPVANVVPSGPVGPARPRRAREEATTPSPKVVAPPTVPVAPPVAPPAPAPAPPSNSAPTSEAPTSPDKPAAPPISAEDHAKNEIQQLVTNYCASLETLKPDRVKKLWPLAPVASLRDQFKDYKSLRCTITSPPKFDRLDASAAGGAQLKFGMKQEIEMRSGGAPKVYETIATMVVSRMNFQTQWLIDRVRHDPKPKN